MPTNLLLWGLDIGVLCHGILFQILLSLISIGLDEIYQVIGLFLE